MHTYTETKRSCFFILIVDWLVYRHVSSGLKWIRLTPNETNLGFWRWFFLTISSAHWKNDLKKSKIFLIWCQFVTNSDMVTCLRRLLNNWVWSSHHLYFRQYMNRRGGFNRPLDFVAWTVLFIYPGIFFKKW